MKHRVSSHKLHTCNTCSLVWHSQADKKALLEAFRVIRTKESSTRKEHIAPQPHAGHARCSSLALCTLPACTTLVLRNEFDLEVLSSTWLCSLMCCLNKHAAPDPISTRMLPLISVSTRDQYLQCDQGVQKYCQALHHHSESVFPNCASR